MLLPGGVWRGGERHRNYAFHPLTGEVELALSESSGSTGNMASIPERVTAVLAAALADVGGGPGGAEAARTLAIGDRQYLVRSLAAHLGRDRVWLTAVCSSCGESFDFEVEQSGLPVKEVRESPEINVELSAGRFSLRPPTGADQEAVAGIGDDLEATRVLARRCLQPLEDSEVAGGEEIELSPEDLAAVDRALEEIAPEVALEALAQCPDCGASHRVEIDPYLCLYRLGDELFGEVHLLASRYHWSESEILALPRERRQRYLGLIGRERG